MTLSNWFVTVASSTSLSTPTETTNYRTPSFVSNETFNRTYKNINLELIAQNRETKRRQYIVV